MKNKFVLYSLISILNIGLILGMYFLVLDEFRENQSHEFNNKRDKLKLTETDNASIAQKNKSSGPYFVGVWKPKDPDNCSNSLSCSKIEITQPSRSTGGVVQQGYIHMSSLSCIYRFEEKPSTFDLGKKGYDGMLVSCGGAGLGLKAIKPIDGELDFMGTIWINVR